MHTENLTILFVDIAGFTATTNHQSRRQNASLLQNFESLLKPIVRKYSGQLVKSIGDALLLTFHSPTDAMLCACRMQDRVIYHSQQHPAEQAIIIRIAAHLGEVRTAWHDIFGEAVNLAARIEAATPAGEIYLSEAVYLAMNKTEVPVRPVGQFALEGFDHQFTLYQVQKHSHADLPFGSSAQQFKQQRPFAFWWLGGAVVAVSLLLGIYWQQQSVSLNAAILPPLQSQPTEYLQLELDALSTAPLNPALMFGVRQRLEQAVARLSGLYLVNPQGQTASHFSLKLAWVAGVFPLPDQLQFRLSVSDDQLLSEWSIDWLDHKNQPNLQRAEQQLVDKLLQHGPFKQLFSAESATEIPDSFYQQYLQGLLSLQQGEETQDIALLSQAKEQLQSIQQALPQFRPAVRALCHNLSILYELSGNIDWLKLAGSVCPGLAERPASNADLLAYGRYLGLSGEKQQAQKALLQVLAGNPKSGQAYTLLSKLYLADKQPLEAELVLKRAIVMQPDYLPAMQLMAEFLLQRGQLEAAIAQFQKVLLLTPDNAMALTNLGSAYLLNGQLQTAAVTYQRALQKSNEPFMLSNLATVYYYLGRLPDAVALYQQALQQGPSNFVLHGNIADAYRQNGQSEEAQLHYRQASQLVISKTNPSARELALHAHYLAQLGELKHSQSQISKALASDNQNAEVWLLDAILKSRQGRLAEAVLSAEQAIVLGYPAKLLAVEPDLQPLANQPDFLALLSPR